MSIFSTFPFTRGVHMQSLVYVLCQFVFNHWDASLMLFWNLDFFYSAIWDDIVALLRLVSKQFIVSCRQITEWKILCLSFLCPVKFRTTAFSLAA